MISSLRNELELVTKMELKKDKYRRFDESMIHNCFIHGSSMLALLKSRKLRKYTNVLLCENAIIYAYQSSALPPYGKNYGSRIHKDTPRFVHNYRTNLGFLLALTEFNNHNGATEILKGSHLWIDRTPPNEKYFNENKKKIKLEKGDAFFFDANLWHRAGTNLSKNWRYALTINFCRPFMRSRFDFPWTGNKR